MQGFVSTSVILLKPDVKRAVNNLVHCRVGEETSSELYEEGDGSMIRQSFNRRLSFSTAALEQFRKNRKSSSKLFKGAEIGSNSTADEQQETGSVPPSPQLEELDGEEESDNEIDVERADALNDEALNVP